MSNLVVRRVTYAGHEAPKSGFVFHRGQYRLFGYLGYEIKIFRRQHFLNMLFKRGNLFQTIDEKHSRAGEVQ